MNWKLKLKRVIEDNQTKEGWLFTEIIKIKAEIKHTQCSSPNKNYFCSKI